MPTPIPSVSGSSTGEFRHDVFISYSSKDGDWVRNTLLPRLEKENLRVCIDFRDFDIGAPSLVNMENAVQQSRKTILVLTPNWVASDWTTFESFLLQGKDPAGRARRMLPLLVHPCALPDRLKMFTYLDVTDPAKFDFQMKRLIAAIRQMPIETPPAPAESAPPPVRRSLGGLDYEAGLRAMGSQLQTTDLDSRLNFSVLESRLWDSLQFERRYGSNETIRSDKARIVEELNRLALVALGQTFNDMCHA